LDRHSSELSSDSQIKISWQLRTGSVFTILIITALKDCAWKMLKIVSRVRFGTKDFGHITNLRGFKPDDLLWIISFLKRDGDAARASVDYQWFGTVAFNSSNKK